MRARQVQQGFEPLVLRYAADDASRLWGWVIFPKGFNAPAMMDIAKLQAWTIKPAILRQAD